MRDELRTWTRYALAALFAFIIFIPVMAFLLLFLSLSAIIIVTTSFAAWVGTLVPIDAWARTVMNRYLDPKRMQLFRDDMLHIFRRHADINDELDRYWMLREMDAATERIDTKLRNGRFAVAIIAGVTSIVLAVLAPIQYIGVVLTVFAIGISTATLARVVIIDILAYDADLYQEASHEEIAARMGWNRGPINGRGAILTALGTIVVGIDDRGYRLSKWVLEEVIAERYRDDEKWTTDEK